MSSQFANMAMGTISSASPTVTLGCVDPKCEESVTTALSPMLGDDLFLFSCGKHGILRRIIRPPLDIADAIHIALTHLTLEKKQKFFTLTQIYETLVTFKTSLWPELPPFISKEIVSEKLRDYPDRFSNKNPKPSNEESWCLCDSLRSRAFYTIRDPFSPMKTHLLRNVPRKVMNAQIMSTESINVEGCASVVKTTTEKVDGFLLADKRLSLQPETLPSIIPLIKHEEDRNVKQVRPRRHSTDSNPLFSVDEQVENQLFEWITAFDPSITLPGKQLSHLCVILII